MKKSEIRIQQDPLTIDFPTMLDALAHPRAFPFVLPIDTPIKVIQTHASAVLLTPDRAYKLKKPKNFGFFDYSTPALRRHFCGEEVLLNRRLAPRVYLGVAPVLANASGRLRFGPTLSPAETPVPGSSLNAVAHARSPSSVWSSVGKHAWQGTWRALRWHLVPQMRVPISMMPRPTPGSHLNPVKNQAASMLSSQRRNRWRTRLSNYIKPYPLLPIAPHKHQQYGKKRQL